MPSIERLLEGDAAMRLTDVLGRKRVRDLLREIVDGLRQEIATGGWLLASNVQEGVEVPTNNNQTLTDQVTHEIEERLKQRGITASRPSLRRVINATGVIIHTNLGRAPLARAAVEAVTQVASHYSNLEYDLSRGERGKRESHCQELIARLAGSKASIVTNNNAAAVLLVLNTLAEGGEVIVSRGELVEIGGSFRIPEVMEKKRRPPQGGRHYQPDTDQRLRGSN